VRTTKFSITLPEGQIFTNGGRHLITISPDGNNIVYVANQQLYSRTLDDTEPRPIRGTIAVPTTCGLRIRKLCRFRRNRLVYYKPVNETGCYDGQSNNFVICIALVQFIPILPWQAQPLFANNFRQFEYLYSTGSIRAGMTTSR